MNNEYDEIRDILKQIMAISEDIQSGLKKEKIPNKITTEIGLVTDQDHEMHALKVKFLNRYFPKIYSRHGIKGFFTIDHPPHAPIYLKDRLSGKDSYNGRYFEPENRWYFATDYLMRLDHQSLFYSFKARTSELSIIENKYSSQLEPFIISSKSDIRIERTGNGLMFAGYLILKLEGEKFLPGSDDVKILKMEVSSNSRSFIINAKASLLIHLPTALVNEFKYNGALKYKIDSPIYWSHDDEKVWRIEKPTEG